MSRIEPKDFFNEEIATFEENKDRLLEEGEGKFVLIKWNKIAGIYSSTADWVQAWIQIFWRVPMLVRKIEKVQKPINIFNRFQLA
jgi:hypothetical protein